MSTATKQQPTKPLRPLEPGDFIPLLRVPDRNGKAFAIETFGGRPGVIFFLPALDKDIFSAFLGYLQQATPAKTDTIQGWRIIVTCNAAETIDALPGNHQRIVCGDVARQLIRDLGLHHDIQQNALGVAYLIDRNLRVADYIHGLGLDALAATSLSRLKETLEAQRGRADARVITSLPPALVIPNALSPQLREKCLAAYHHGEPFKGTVGAGREYKPGIKTRMDFVLGRELSQEIDEKLAKSVVPEIQKIFGMQVSFREPYKVGEYKAEEGGHFVPHRDNFDPPLGYRRFAVSIQLNDDFEGGGVRFNEYSDDIIAPPRDAAVIFSCAVMHEAVKVTAGSRFILLTFMHGDDDEAFRRHYQSTHNQSLKLQDYALRASSHAMIPQSRDFFWKRQAMQPPPASKEPPAPALAFCAQEKPLIITQTVAHQPRKVFECKEAIVFDDFLPEEIYQRMYDFAIKSDYQRINTNGPVARAWCVEDGFPFRSTHNYFYYAPGFEPPRSDYHYPTRTDADTFIEHILAIQPQVEHIIGKQGTGWEHFSFTSWMYPPGTALSMHDDGAGSYHGAYAYYLNPVWRPHWGGLNILIDEKGNAPVYAHAQKIGGMEFYRRKWLHANQLDEILMDYGFGHCIFPKRNRIVFIADNAYHMVTRVNETAGDNHRLSLTGFFNRPKSAPGKKETLGGYE